MDSTEKTEFFLRTDMSEKEIGRCIEASRDLAKKAVAQHKQGIAEAVIKIEEILKEVGGLLEDQTGYSWSPALVQDQIPGALISHVVFATEKISKEELGDTQFHILVQTFSVRKEIRPGEIYVGYRTIGRAAFPDTEDDDTEIAVSDVIKPLEFGEVI